MEPSEGGGQGTPDKSPEWMNPQQLKAVAMVTKLMKAKDDETAREGQDGPCRTYYENGQLQAEAIYQKGKLTGPIRLYYESGELGMEAIRKGGKGGWQCGEYYKNGRMFAEFCIENGALNGLLRKYNANGQLEYEETYKEGKLWVVRTYDENGQLRSEEAPWLKKEALKDGFREGPVTDFLGKTVFIRPGVRKNVVLDGLNLVRAFTSVHEEADIIAYFKTHWNPSEAEMAELNRLLREWRDYVDFITDVP